MSAVTEVLEPPVREQERVQNPLARTLDVHRVRDDFPALHQEVHGKPLAYLDNAATAQKPEAVIQAIAHFYRHDCSNIHRGVHLLSQRATDSYEATRRKVQRFMNARSDREIVFTSGATEAINLVAQTFGRTNLREGDEILLTELEHHSNIVPWQMLCEQTGAVLRVAPINDAGELLLEEFEALLGPRTRLVSVSQMSNALGTVTPAKELVRMAHEHGAVVLVDGAQAIQHTRVDVQDLDCDFYVFSGHKLYGPTGIGVLYGKSAVLEAMPPYQGGGDMISSVTFAKTTYNDVPYKFEAGTPNIAGGVGLGTAIDYVTGLDWDAVLAYEQDLLDYGTQALLSVPGVRIIGTARHKASVLSFLLSKNGRSIHPHDIGTILDYEGVAIRTGHHCAQPLMERLGIPATARASLAFYNTREEMDALVNGIHRVLEMF